MRQRFAAILYSYMNSGTNWCVIKGYLLQKPERPNLKILTKAKARKIVFRDGTVDHTGLVEADGIEFEYEGVAHTVHAKREVVLAAGYGNFPAELLNRRLIRLS